MGKDLSHLSDELLIHEIQTGNRTAFAEIVNRHAKRFYSIAYRILFNKDEAEDVVQQAFLKLWEKRLDWNNEKRAKFTTWFYRVVINLCFDHNRKKKELSLENFTNSNGNSNLKHERQDTLFGEGQKQALLERYIWQLPERQRLALDLCFYEGLSNKEAAGVMGIKLKALQSLIMRAKKTLKDKLNRDII